MRLPLNEDSKRHRHRRRRGRRPDFWHDWREERQRDWEEGRRGHGRPPGHRENARHWRAYFHNFMGADPEDHWAFGGRRFSPWRQGMDSFNPLVAGMMSKGGGLLPLIVLNLLHEQPHYGNEIMELITERTNGQWIANPGAIYPLISVLEERGLVSGEWEDPVKRTVRIYKLTDEGTEELVRMKAIMRPKIEEAIDVLDQLTIDLNGDPADDKPTNYV
ncbi:MAG: PadR family transcriptional regulator [Anaerolineae bacterium]|nr:PadR family transcriptional regulator [Anaerolineae bacterium]MCO5206419.1 PadR family transcriptional regulator [Anaerolineae bacterium]